jgi:hypothetical protein
MQVILGLVLLATRKADERAAPVASLDMLAAETPGTVRALPLRFMCAIFDGASHDVPA